MEPPSNNQKSKKKRADKKKRSSRSSNGPLSPDRGLQSSPSPNRRRRKGTDEKPGRRSNNSNTPPSKGDREHTPNTSPTKKTSGELSTNDYVSDDGIFGSPSAPISITSDDFLQPGGLRVRRSSEPLLNSWAYSLLSKGKSLNGLNHGSELTTVENHKTSGELGDVTMEEKEEDTTTTGQPYDDLGEGDTVEVLNSVLEQKKATSQIKYRGPGETKIKLATVDCLIGKLADHDYQDRSYIDTFLATYDYFLDSVTFLKMLVNHYRVPKLQEDDGIIDDKYRKVIQLRVINVLKKWMEVKYSILRKNKEWNDLVHKFVKFLMSKGIDEEKSWGMLLTKYMTEEEESRQPTPYPRSTKRINDFMEISPSKLAEQMTLIDHNMFKAVKLDCYYHKCWENDSSSAGGKDNKTEKSGVHKIIDRFNEVSAWVATEIVIVANNRKQRSQKIIKFIQLMDFLKQHKNFNGVMQIYSALNTAAVLRLKKAWRDVPSRWTTTYNNLNKIFTQEGNFKLYREHIESAVPPAVPYQGLILADLTFIEESPNFITDVHQFVNWEKMTLLAKVFGDIIKFQKSKYTIKDDPEVMEFLLCLSERCKVATDDELHQRSLAAERDEKDDKDLILPESKPTKKTRNKTKPVTTFDSIWKSQDLFADFKKYLEQMYNVENLLFYKEAVTYRTMVASNRKEVDDMACRIFQTYISDETSCEYQVSLNIDTKKGIEGTMAAREKEQLTLDLFLQAELEIEFLLKTCFSNFLQKQK